MTTTPNQNPSIPVVGEELEHWDDTEYEDYEEWCDRMKKERYSTQELDESSYLLTQEHYESELIDNSQRNWQDMIDTLTLHINERNPDSPYWDATAKNLGWLHRSGSERFSVRPGADEKEGNVFLRALLPRTECTFHIYDYSSPNGTIKGLAIRNSHHDAMNEWYYCIPVSSEDDEDE